MLSLKCRKGDHDDCGQRACIRDCHNGQWATDAEFAGNKPGDRWWRGEQAFPSPVCANCGEPAEAHSFLFRHMDGSVGGMCFKTGCINYRERSA